MRPAPAAPRRSPHHLEARVSLAELRPEVQRALPLLSAYLEDAVQVLVRVMVDARFGGYHAAARRRGTAAAQVVQLLNRSRRAARAWIHAVLSGRTDTGTRHALLHSWLPDMGLKPSAQTRTAIQDCFERFRGAATGLIAAVPEECLVPQAKALHALESVLAIHLGFVEAETAAVWQRPLLQSSAR